MQMEAAGIDPGLEAGLGLVIPGSACNMVGARMNVRHIPAIHPARQRKLGREQGRMGLGRRCTAACGNGGKRIDASLDFFDLHYYLIYLGLDSDLATLRFYVGV